MRHILVKSLLVLGLGVAPGIGLAQTEIPKKKPLQTEEQTQTGTGQGTDPSGAATGQQMEGQPDAQPEGQAQAPAEQGTTGATTRPMEDQSGANKLKKPDQQTGGQAQAPAEQNTEQQGATTKQKMNGQTGEPAAGTARTGDLAPDDDTAKTQDQPSSETTGSVNLTTEQRTEIRQVITETKAEPVGDVNFEINVGVAVPRSIELQPLPPRIVRIVPRYEHYEYFVLADGRIVIVEPDTLEIVLVIA